MAEQLRTKLRRIFAYLMARLQENSTMRALVLLATGCFAWDNPDRAEHIITVGLLAVGVIGSILPDQVWRGAKQRADNDLKRQKGQ